MTAEEDLRAAITKAKGMIAGAKSTVDRLNEAIENISRPGVDLGTIEHLQADVEAELRLIADLQSTLADAARELAKGLHRDG